MIRPRIKHYKGVLWIVSFIFFLFVFFYFVNPQEIIESLGVTNSYLVLFFVALIGGASSFTSSSYYAAIVTFAVSGLNPFWMALIAGIGLTIGDSIFYLLGTWGRNNISGHARMLAEKYAGWFSQKPKRFIQAIVYIYTGFSPFPGNLLMIVLSFARFPYKSFILPVLLGNITLVLVISLGVIWGIGLI